MLVVSSGLAFEDFHDLFGSRFGSDVPLARFTSARIGGPAAGLITVNDRDQLTEAISVVWERNLPYRLLGGGSNVLVSDAGYSGIVILNRARQINFDESISSGHVWAESGASLGLIARLAAARGYGGLAWAAGIPGTLGGAVVGNAGAHGSDMEASLAVAEILQHKGMREEWTSEQLDFGYRTSIIKKSTEKRIVLSGKLNVYPAELSEIQQEMDEYLAYRRRTQPPGASMGSMFKNPPDDYAGRLIEEVGLKGLQVGNAQISPLHGNFFINHGGAMGQDVGELIVRASEAVFEKYGIKLELEVELIGEWPQYGT